MMRNKDYFTEMGLDPSQLGKMLDTASDRIFTFSRWNEPDGALFRTRSRKVKYRIISQQKRSEIPLSY
jgi:hypothetical protein